MQAGHLTSIALSSFFVENNDVTVRVSGFGICLGDWWSTLMNVSGWVMEVWPSNLMSGPLPPSLWMVPLPRLPAATNQASLLHQALLPCFCLGAS